MSKEIVGQCYRCLKRAGNECSVFIDPAYQWRKGKKCFGYVDEPLEMAKMYEDMAWYELNNNNADFDAMKWYKKMADEWRRIAERRENA